MKFCRLWIFLVLILLTSCGATGEPVAPAETVLFVDDLGREVELPQEIQSVIPAGTIGQMMLYSIAPEKMVGLSSELTETQASYFPQEMAELPVYGQFYGNGGTTNYEAIMTAAPDLILDIGEEKSGIVADLDLFSQKTGIPVVYLAGDLDSYDQTYLKLGQLLGKEEQSEALSTYAAQVMENLPAPPVDQTNVLYITTEQGVQVYGRNTIHTQTLDKVGLTNACPYDAVAGSGADTIPTEEILTWDIDAILVAGDPCVITEDPLWQTLPAVAQGNIHTVPSAPFSLLGRPPAVQRLLGVQWLGSEFYPDLYPQDMEEVAEEFYALFYGMNDV